MRFRLKKTLQYLFFALVVVLLWRELEWIDGNRSENAAAAETVHRQPLVAGVQAREQRSARGSVGGGVAGYDGGVPGGAWGREPLWQDKHAESVNAQRDAGQDGDSRVGAIHSPVTPKQISINITKLDVVLRAQPGRAQWEQVNETRSKGNSKVLSVAVNDLKKDESKPIPLHLHLNDLSNLPARKPPPVANFTIIVHNPGDFQSEPQINKQTELSDVFIGVKTTGKYHRDRLQVILDTWYSLAPEQTNFFTDVDDIEFQQKSNGHMINTQCQGTHSRLALCCKTSVMFNLFYKSNKRWLCNVDDDNYLNVPELMKLLRQYEDRQDHYLGRASLSHPIEAIDRDTNERVSFWFATGGAGFCISRSLAMKMAVYASSGTFERMCNRIRLPDDVTIGFIIEVLLKKPMTKVQTFNSHLQQLRSIPTNKLQNQITLSYSITEKRVNTINMPSSLYNVQQDPTRFKTFHCTYFRGFGNCPLVS